MEYRGWWEGGGLYKVIVNELNDSWFERIGFIPVARPLSVSYESYWVTAFLMVRRCTRSSGDIS